eukprot:1730989-Amphidinium_carterae.1
MVLWLVLYIPAEAILAESLIWILFFGCRQENWAAGAARSDMAISSTSEASRVSIECCLRTFVK